MQLFLMVGSRKSQRFAVESFSFVGVAIVVAGEDDNTTAVGSTDVDFGCGSSPTGARSVSCHACSANRLASSGLQE